MARTTSEPRLTRLGPRWRIVWRDTSLKRTRQLSLGEASSAEAHKRFARFLAATDKGRAANGDLRFDFRAALSEPEMASSGRPLVSEIVAAYVAAKGEDPAFRPILAELGDREVASIDLQACEDYDLARAPRASGTVRRELAMLKAAVNHAFKRKRISSDQMPVIEMPPAGEPRSRWLSHEELDRLLRAAAQHYRPHLGTWVDCVAAPPPRVYVFVELAYWTGARAEAVETLRWEQVDLEAGSINFNPPGRARTRKRRAVVGIAKRPKALLEDMRQRAETEWVLSHPGSIRKAFENAVDRAGLGGVTRNTLRHTRATHLLRAGHSPIKVANLLGHSVETLLRNYAHAMPADSLDSFE